MARNRELSEQEYGQASSTLGFQSLSHGPVNSDSRTSDTKYRPDARLLPNDSVLFKTATRNPATYLGLMDMVGTVEQGKKADLVLLEANPLENMSNTKRINAVVVNGRLIPKVSLDKMLKDAEADR